MVPGAPSNNSDLDLDFEADRKAHRPPGVGHDGVPDDSAYRPAPLGGVPPPPPKGFGQIFFRAFGQTKMFSGIHWFIEEVERPKAQGLASEMVHGPVGLPTVAAFCSRGIHAPCQRQHRQASPPSTLP